MSIYALLAQSLVYPYPGLQDELQAGAAAAGKGPAQRKFAVFTRQIGRLSVEEWEELATRTLDLSPAAAPYIGFQVWGESYQRSAFMAQLNRAMNARWTLTRRASCLTTWSPSCATWRRPISRSRSWPST